TQKQKKMFGEIFKKNRTTEPNSVFPVIVDSVIETSFLPVPDSGISEYNKECVKYIKQPSISTSSEYNGGFQGTEVSNSAMNLSVLDSGLVPDLVKLTYITSTQELIPTINSSTPQNLFIELIIEPQSFIVQVQTDKRLKTVLASFGLLGGAYGLAIGLLVLLFGNNAINPWGFVQRYNKTMQTNLMIFSELIPNSNNIDSEVSIQELKELKQKLDLLQLLLSDYLVNAQYLEKVQQLEMKSSKECNN
ncbi:2593_t:CDS:2, partial [Gigaspora rosea]